MNMRDKTVVQEEEITTINCKIVFLFSETTLMFENYDLESIVTPVKHVVLSEFLRKSSYDLKKTQYLVEGFKNRFSIEYDSPTEIKRLANNLKIRVGSKLELWNKVMKEVKLKRFAGPFEQPPFQHFIQSPIGLVDKDHGKDTRLIFHLSYPKGGETSVNANTLKDFCHVRYVDFDQAVALCLKEIGGDRTQTVFIGKSDYKSAFRNVGLNRKSWLWLILKAESPIDGRTYFFVDKCLPFRHSN